MNECRSDERRWCFFHPRELVVGVCALCLNERLLVVAASKQKTYSFTPKRVLPKIFALTNLLTRSEIKLHKSDTATSSPSPEDSFISIKFEENGVASWDKGKISKISHGHDQCDHEMSNLDRSKKIKSVIEHTKPRGSLRWRRRIGHLFQLIKRKRSGKGDMCHVGTKLEREKVKYGWIRILTKRRAKE